MKNPNVLRVAVEAPVVKALHRGAWALGLTLGLMAGAAQADPLRFSFEIEFASGPMAVANQKAFGSFNVDSNDCVALVCSGTFATDGNFLGSLTKTLLDFQVVVDGVTFSASSDDAYPDFPMVTLANNVLTGIDFSDSGAPAYAPALMIYGGPGTWGGTYTNASFDPSVIGTITQVPEPSSWALMLGGLAACGAVVRRRWA